jgi:hypothetical protein
MADKKFTINGYKFLMKDGKVKLDEPLQTMHDKIKKEIAETKDKIKENIAEQETDNEEEIIYRVNKRNIFYILGGDILPTSLLLFMSIPMLTAVNTNVKLICIGLILFIIGMHFLLSTITFNEFIIYKDRVVIRRFFVKDECIYISNIKSVETASRLLMKDLFFICKNERRYAFMLRLSIPSLHDKDTYKIEEIIKNLQQEQENGKQ